VTPVVCRRSGRVVQVWCAVSDPRRSAHPLLLRLRPLRVATVAATATVAELGVQRVEQRDDRDGGARVLPLAHGPQRRPLHNSDAQVANRNSKGWHGATENGP
jgi:hypothetical protein